MTLGPGHALPICSLDALTRKQLKGRCAVHLTNPWHLHELVEGRLDGGGEVAAGAAHQTAAHAPRAGALRSSDC